MELKRLTKRPMYLALTNGHAEAAKILARKGAPDFTEEEKGYLGEKYTNFQQIQQTQGECKEEEGKSKG